MGEELGIYLRGLQGLRMRSCVHVLGSGRWDVGIRAWLPGLDSESLTDPSFPEQFPPAVRTERTSH